MPGPLTLNRLDRFLEENGHRYAVDWIDANTNRVTAGVGQVETASPTA